jgi:hypothetical protein
VCDLALACFRDPCPSVPLHLQLLSPLPGILGPLPFHLNDGLQPFDLFL